MRQIRPPDFLIITGAATNIVSSLAYYNYNYRN